MVADKLFWQCDEQARSRLLDDAHHWVRSCAELARSSVDVGAGGTRAVKDYRMVGGKFVTRWYPMVPGFPGQFVRPEGWIQAHCPDGYSQPELAHVSAQEYLSGRLDHAVSGLAVRGG